MAKLQSDGSRTGVARYAPHELGPAAGMARGQRAHGVFVRSELPDRPGTERDPVRATCGARDFVATRSAPERNGVRTAAGIRTGGQSARTGGV